MRHEIERGRAQLLPEECEDSSNQATAEATGASSCAVATHEDPAEDLDVLSLLSRLRSLPELQTPPTADTALACLLERMGAMMQPLQLFCRTAQLRETTGLSKAAVLGTCRETENDWNILQHELALGRQASALQTGCGQRMSRAQNWTNRQLSMHKPKDHGSEHSPLGMVTHFGSHTNPQILLFLRKDGSVGEALVMCVYRGAVLDGSGTRRLQVSRPSASALPLGLCRAVRVVELVQAYKQIWIASSLNPVFLLEPSDALAVWHPESTTTTAEKTSFKFSPEDPYDY